MEDIKPYNTLFLDRDGVINQQRPHDYVKTTREFIFIDGALEALRLLAPLFKHIIIVTNQRGVGKGIMTRKDLEEIHAYMMNEVSGQGGRIDKIYVCTDTSDYSKNRKPNTGMALQAKDDFPDIDFTKSIMAGDSISDMQFAQNAGIPRSLIGEKYENSKDTFKSQYNWFPDLLTFAKQLIKDIQA